MDNATKTILALGVGLGAAFLLAKKPQAAEEFTCPYGDHLTFATLAELQSHVAAVHPGERIPITIQWK